MFSLVYIILSYNLGEILIDFHDYKIILINLDLLKLFKLVKNTKFANSFYYYFKIVLSCLN